jgi:hypothetical protein
VGGEAFGCDVEREGCPDEAGAQVRVYATSLAVLPGAAVPYSLPFGELSSFAFDEGRYAVDLATASGRVSLLRLGQKTQPFVRLLEQRVADLRKRIAEALSSLVPALPTLSARRLAQAIAGRRPGAQVRARRHRPDVWTDLLQAAVGEAALRESIAALAARCRKARAPSASRRPTSARTPPGRTQGRRRQEGSGRGAGRRSGELDRRCGRRRGGAGRTHGQPGRLVRVPHLLGDRARPGNAVAIEAATRAGRATYLFRIAPVEVYRQASAVELKGLARDRIRSVSRALVALGFKREPISTWPTRRSAPGATPRYRLALRLSEPLQATRAAFVGRAIHNQGWSAQVDERPWRAPWQVGPAREAWPMARAAATFRAEGGTTMIGGSPSPPSAWTSPA